MRKRLTLHVAFELTYHMTDRKTGKANKHLNRRFRLSVIEERFLIENYPRTTIQCGCTIVLVALPSQHKPAMKLWTPVGRSSRIFPATTPTVSSGWAQDHEAFISQR